MNGREPALLRARRGSGAGLSPRSEREVAGGGFERHGSAGPSLAADRGSATAETAIVLPVVVLLLCALAVLGVGFVQEIRLESAARAAAREVARGEEQSTVEAAARRAGGSGTHVSITRDGDWVHVQVSRTLHPIGTGLLPGSGITLTARAVARIEPSLLTSAPRRGSPARPPMSGAS